MVARPVAALLITSARWAVGGLFLEALAGRDFGALAATLGPSVRFRALLPPGPMRRQGPDDVADEFRSWFGGAEGLHVIEQQGCADADDTVGSLDLLCFGFLAERTTGAGC